MRTLRLICFGLWLVWIAAGTVRADTFQLADGRAITGEVLPASANDQGVQIKLEENKYERIPWNSFSQEDLRKFLADKKMGPLAEPFIEQTQEEKIQRTAVEMKPVPRLERPPSQSLLGAFFGSGLGVLTLLLVYAANIYSAYEIAIFRAQPVGLVCGVAAVAPFVGPIIFLSLPTRLPPSQEDEEGQTVAEAPTFAVPRPEAQAAAEDASHGSLRLSRQETPQASSGAHPPPQIFQRGAFTFNRRFFETKFPGFFGVVRREGEKDMVLFIKSHRGTFVAQRITRITGNDMHVQVHKGAASEEIMVAFSEIQEVQLKHQDA